MGWAVIAKTCQRSVSRIEHVLSSFAGALLAPPFVLARALFGDSPTLTGNFLPRRDIVSDLAVLMGG